MKYDESKNKYLNANIFCVNSYSENSKRCTQPVALFNMLRSATTEQKRAALL